MFYAVLGFIYLVYYIFFFQPFCFECVALHREHRYFLPQLLELNSIVLSFYGFTFYLQLAYAALEFIQCFGHRVEFQLQLGCALIYKVYGLIGKESIGNVPMR